MLCEIVTDLAEEAVVIAECAVQNGNETACGIPVDGILQ
jgi:hypothetical protein